MGGDARQDIFEPGEWFHVGPLAGSHEAPQHGRRFAATVTAEEQPVVSAYRYAPDGALGGVMPIPVLCRVRGLLSLPAVLSMLLDAA
jgi:hypothetical protein